MGRATRPLHDPGNHRPVERRSHRQAARRGRLTIPASPAGESEITALLHHALGRDPGSFASKCISMRVQGSEFKIFGTIFPRLIRRRRNGSATQLKNLSRYLNVLFAPPRTKAMSSSTRFAGAGRRSMRRKSSDEPGRDRRYASRDFLDRAAAQGRVFRRRVRGPRHPQGPRKCGRSRAPRQVPVSVVGGVVGRRMPLWRQEKGRRRRDRRHPFFRSDKDKTEKALISVKGGDNVGVGMVRDLIAVVEREKAAVGVLISLALPMRAMEREAMAAGFFEGPFEAVPKIQLITLAEGGHPADRRRRHLPHRRARKHRQPGPPAVGSYNSEESINYWSCRRRQAKARTTATMTPAVGRRQRDCSSLRSSQ